MSVIQDENFSLRFIVVKKKESKLVRQSQIVQSVIMYSYDALISSYIILIPAIHSWFCRSARDKVVFYVDFRSF